MSDTPRVDHDSSNMVVSYASELPNGHNRQTLPSFRELLPPHLHDEIESTSYFSSVHPPTHEREILPPPDASSTSLNGRSAATVPARQDEQPHPRGLPESSNAHLQATPTSHFAARGPSPILPSIRDLQSLSDRNLAGANAPYAADIRGPGPHPQSPGHVDRHHAFIPALPGQRPPEAYMNVAGGPPPPLLASASQTPYAHPGMSFPAEGEPGSSDVPPWLQPGLNMRTEPVDSNGRRRRGNLPKPVTTILRNWFHEHLDHPYPSEEDKQMLVTRTGLSISQISNWFINARRRQLPALRNQMRSNGGPSGSGGGGGSDNEAQQHSPLSDSESTNQDSMSSPTRF